MTESYPQRHASHTLENRSENYLRNKLPQDWVVHRISNDYGQDLQIEIVENGKLTGLEFIVQLKASNKPTGLYFETIRVRLSTYNYLKSKLGIVLLIKYVEEKDEAYYCFLRDIPKPNPEQQEFTVRIPLANRISDKTWEIVVNRIRGITSWKL